MSFEDFFEKDDNKRHHDRHYGDFQYSHSQRHSSDKNSLSFLTNLIYNPKLRILIIIALFALLTIIIFAIILLFPVFEKIINYVAENGIQGFIEMILKGKK